MTRDERNQRWREIFDNYDRAIGATRENAATIGERLAPLLASFIDHIDEIAGRVDRIAKAVHEANRAALALYADERDDDGQGGRS